MTGGRTASGLAALLLTGASLVGATVAPAARADTATGGTPTGARGPAQLALPAVDRPPVGAGALAIRISRFEPDIPEAGDTLRVSGTITNISDAPVDDVSAVLRVSPTALPSRGEVPEVLSGAGAREGYAVPGSATEVTDQLAAGEVLPFTVEAPIDDLGLTGPGVYVTGAEALGSTGGSVQRQDLDRSFLPWWPEGTTARPLLLTTLWPLTTPPLRDAEGVLLSEAPAVEMSPSGRLWTLLEVAADEPGAVSIVLDPDAVAAAAQMSDGYQVRQGATTVPGARDSEVARWLESVKDAATDPRADVVAMLSGQPDLVAARRGKLLGTVLGQRPIIDAQTAQALGRPLPAELAVLPGGASDARTLAGLASAAVGAAVLSDASLGLTTATYFTPSGAVLLPTAEGDLPVLVTDSGLSAALAMPMRTEAEQTAARQRLLAETLVATLELPETQRLLVAAPEAGWAPPTEAARMVVEVATGTPWLIPTTIGEALSREPSTLERTLADYGPEQVDQELDARDVAEVRTQFRGLAEYRGILTDSDDLSTTARTAPNRGLAAWFRSHPDVHASFLDDVGGQVDQALDSVTVVSSGSVTVSGTSGTIPVTVENLGSVPVTVGLTLSSTPPQLFVAEPLEPFRIDPQRRASVEVVAQVAAAGPIPVTIQITTEQGASFGTPGRITVQSSAYANAARILVRVALAALLLAVVVHGVRRARRRHAAATASRAGAPGG